MNSLKITVIGLVVFALLFVGTAASEPVELDSTDIQTDVSTGAQDQLTEQDAPPLTTEESPVAEPEQYQSLSEQEWLERYEYVLQDQNVDVQSVEQVDEVIALEYQSVQTTEYGLGEEIAKVIGGYSVLVDEGLDYQLEATIYTVTGEEVGTFTAEPAWAEEYNTGQIDEAAFLERVFDTIEVSE